MRDFADRHRLDELKGCVARHSSIPPQKIVALTPQGRSLKLQSLHTEKEIYIYDIRITQPMSPGGAAPVVSQLPQPKRYAVPNAPNSIGDIKSISAWQELNKARRAWAMEVAEECARMDVATQERYNEMDVMVKCLDAAVTNLELSVTQIQPKYKELKEWADSAIQDYNKLAGGWEGYLSLARSIQISPAMVNFMTSQDVSNPKSATLELLIDLDTARKAGRLAPTSLQKLKTRAADLDRVASQMYQGLEGLIHDFEKLVGRSVLSHSGETAQLQQDIEAVAHKIDTDYHTMLEYSTSQRDVLQASKTSSTHTERLIPGLMKRAREMDDQVQYATRARNIISTDSVDFMRKITDITSLHAAVKGKINDLNQAEDDMTTFDYLRLIHQLPYMYASFVAEAVRRREWSDKVKTDSSTLANTMAIFQDEEVKRRRKWHKMVGSTYGPDRFETNALGLEINLLGDEDPWPVVTKHDLEAFLDQLHAQKAEPGIINDVSKLLNDVNAPTKLQSKRIKAFKNGSVHEAALGISGLLTRGDDDLLRTLQDDKTRLESKLKTAESRIKRLEDLLHRGTSTSRPSPGVLFQPQGTDSTSSVKPARGDNTELLQQRIAQLEAELNNERQKSALFEKDLSTRTTQHNNIKGQMEEANSTKKDLLENMEALKREFMDERKSLEEEIKTLRARLEDTEDEIENFGASRENEKASYNEQLLVLQSEIQRLEKERNDESLKAQGQVEFLRNESRLQRDRNESLERQLQASQEQAKSLTRKLVAAEELGQLQRRALEELHGQLCPGEVVPDDANDMMENLFSAAPETVSRLQTLESDIALLRSDLEQAQTTVKDLRSEVADKSEKLSVEADASRQLREDLSEERARSTALEKELAEGREQLSQLRIQLTDGESGSEALRKQLEEGEGKITKLHEELASRQSQVGSLEEELRLFKERRQEAQAKVSSLTAQIDGRTERAKDLTQRIYSQNDRLCRLLERLGFAVTRQGSKMTVQKIPRTERSTQLQNPNDSSDPGSASARRSTTLASDSTDLELLYWMNSQDGEAEAEKYNAFMAALGAFDVDLFSETVYRRLRDMEHLARKFQREARAHKEKVLSLQKEGHDKIAFKNFKEGDLALFLPTRNQSSGAWACFNVGFPHYFLREQDSHQLKSKEWLVARISRIQERVVDLSKSIQQPGDADSMLTDDNDNPFQLSDGLRWYLLDAYEDKHAAPSTPGLGKSTVAANTVEAVADMRSRSGTGTGKDKAKGAHGGIDGVSKTLSKSLESRRSSTSSRKALPFNIGAGSPLKKPVSSETNSLRAAAPETPAGASPTHGGHLAASSIPNLPPTSHPQKPQPDQDGQAKKPEDGQGNEAEVPQQPGQEPRDSASASAAASDRPQPPEVRSEIDSLLGPT
jgi:autophagy-related protein 11